MANRLITNVLGCGLAVLLISGCSSTPPIQKIEVSAKPIEKPDLVLPPADTLRMRPVEWVLITPENFEEEVEKIKKTGRPVVFFALTDKGYENLGLNFSDIRALIQQKNAIIAAYESYYKKSNEAIDQANSQLEENKKAVDEAQKPKEESGGWKFNPFK